MRVDAHHHLWRYDPESYPWIREEMGVLRRDYLPADLEPLLADSRIARTVLVQAQQTIDETRWMLDIADAHPAIDAVVGWVPLVSRDAPQLVEELAARRALRGLRHILHDEPDDRYALRDDFNRGLSTLRRSGLVYDILIFARHLPHAIALVDRHPHQVFVLDHIGKPAIAAAGFDALWARGLRTLAERPHVFCKLSGIVTEVRDKEWTPDFIRPYLDTALEAFGPSRLMFGTDWPVCLLRCGYAEWVTTVDAYVRSLTAGEQEAIMGGTAARVYRVDDGRS
jgi:L-fuconolactonase